MGAFYPSFEQFGAWETKCTEWLTHQGQLGETESHRKTDRTVVADRSQRKGVGRGKV